MKIGIWAADLTDWRGRTRCRASELAAYALQAALPDDEVVIVTAAETARPSVFLRLALLTLAARRGARAAWHRAAGSRLRQALLVLLALPLLPLAIPLLALWLATRIRPSLHDHWWGFVRSQRLPLADDRLAREAGCDAWAVLSPRTSFPFPAGVPCVWLLDGPPGASVHFDEDSLERLVSLEGSSSSVNATLFAATDPAALLAQKGPGSLAAVHTRFRRLSEGWRALLDEAAGLPIFAPPQRSASSPKAGRPVRIHLFLPVVYRGGVWEASVPLLAGLDEIVRERRLAEFSLAVMPGQPGLDQLARAAPGLRIEWLTQQTYPNAAYFHSPSALAADAWFALVDRFSAPVDPPVPLAVLVYDVIQRHAPELFSQTFLDEWRPAMRATVARASLVVTTNPVTRRDAAVEYGIAEDAVALVPVACEPAARFAGLCPEPVAADAPDGFLLNITNISPHKGLECVLRACAAAKARRGGTGPGLVVTGNGTERVNPGVQDRPEGGSSNLSDLRRLVTELGLVPGRDVWFLGYTSDAQLLGLLERCSGVINAARHDNGTFSLLEAHYFGKQAISSRYPTAEALYARFGVPVDYFPPGDHDALAGLMLSSRPPTDQRQLAANRAALADPRLGHRQYAERFHELLLDLARGARLAKAA